MALPSMTVFAKPPAVAPLTELEETVLSIMALGEDMYALGSWEAPVKALAARGFVQKAGPAYRITAAGQAAFDAMEDAEMRGMVGEHNARVRERDAVVIDGTADPCPHQ